MKRHTEWKRNPIVCVCLQENNKFVSLGFVGLGFFFVFPLSLVVFYKRSLDSFMKELVSWK